MDRPVHSASSVVHGSIIAVHGGYSVFIAVQAHDLHDQMHLDDSGEDSMAWHVPGYDLAWFRLINDDCSVIGVNWVAWKFSRIKQELGEE